MKNITLILLIFSFGTLQAQIVTIPDANFKNALLNHDPVIDTNSDGELQLSEAEAFAGTLNLFDKDISNLTGLETFVNITGLDCSQNSISNIDVSANDQLVLLNCGNNDFTSIDVSNNVLLQVFSCSSSLITSLDLSQNTALSELYLPFSAIETLDLTSNVNLRVINLFGNQPNPLEITSLNVSTLIDLEELLIDHTKINSLDVSFNNKLKYLNCKGTYISTLDLSMNQDLVMLVVDRLDLEELDLSENKNLELLSIKENNFSSYDFGSIPSLRWVDFSENPFTEVDFSSNELLCGMYGNECPNLTFINVRNGNNTEFQYGDWCNFNTGGDIDWRAPSGIYVSNNPQLTTMCVDNVSYAEKNFSEVQANVNYTENCELNIDGLNSIEVSIYPNPVTDELYLTSGVTLSSISVMNLLGQQVLSATSNSNIKSLDVSNLDSGTYFVRVTAATSSQVFQIIKQ